MAIEDRNLPVGTRIWANYKKTRYVCTVEAGEEEGSVAFVLEDGSKHKSPSAAGSKVMDGKAVNGWRFWTVEGDPPAASEAEAKPEKKSRGGKKKPSKTVFKTPSQASPRRARRATSAAPAWRPSRWTARTSPRLARRATATTTPSSTPPPASAPPRKRR
jgi:hypothetical protein